MEGVSQSTKRCSLLDRIRGIRKCGELFCVELVDRTGQLCNCKIGYGIGLNVREGDSVYCPPKRVVGDPFRIMLQLVDFVLLFASTENRICVNGIDIFLVLISLLFVLLGEKYILHNVQMERA